MGYYRAGFDVTGIDIASQKHYPFEFIQADALEYIADHGSEYDVIHASPPCQHYSEETPMDCRDNHPDLIAPVRELLRATGKPYVIENVEGARSWLLNPVMLCGSMFSLPIFRHRYFETWPHWYMSPRTCDHSFVPVMITGTTRRKGVKRADAPVALRREAIGIDWMVITELDEAIPPAYTEWIGNQLMTYLEAK